MAKEAEDWRIRRVSLLSTEIRGRAIEKKQTFQNPVLSKQGFMTVTDEEDVCPGPLLHHQLKTHLVYVTTSQPYAWLDQLTISVLHCCHLEPFVGDIAAVGGGGIKL